MGYIFPINLKNDSDDVCGDRNSSGDLMVVTAHRRSAFKLVIKFSENSMYG